MKRMFVGVALLALCGCNAARTPPAAALSGAPTVVAAMPMGSDCASAIARYRAVAKSDADTGNVGASVYAQMDGEIRGAEAACAAGRDGEALSLLASSKARHGYPAGR